MKEAKTATQNVTWGVSVVVCCHNSAARLPQTLAHLQAQQVPSGFCWEVIVVDNASTDDTSNVAKTLWGECASAPLLIVKEPKLGLSHARMRGIESARYELVSFVDDDNWLAPNWISVAFQIMTEHPEVGACGGSGEAVFQVDPPAWFPQFEHAYAVGKQSSRYDDITEITDWGESQLWGAGLTIRVSAWKDIHSKGFKVLLKGRTGKVLISGEDYEICNALRLAGWHLWYAPTLRFQHYIPEQRLTWSYLLKLHRGFGFSNAKLDAYRMQFKHSGISNSKILGYYWINQVARSLFHICVLIPFKILKEKDFYWKGNKYIVSWNFIFARMLGILSLHKNYDDQIEVIRKTPWNRQGILKNEQN